MKEAGRVTALDSRREEGHGPPARDRARSRVHDDEGDRSRRRAGARGVLRRRRPGRAPSRADAAARAQAGTPASASARPTAGSRSNSTSSSTTGSTSPRSPAMVAVARHLRGRAPHGPRRHVGRRARGQRAESRVIDLATVRRLAAAALESIEAAPAADQRAERLPRPRRRHRDEPREDDAGHRRRRSSARPRRRRRELAAESSGPRRWRRKGQLGGDPLARSSAAWRGSLGEREQVDGDVPAEALRAGGDERVPGGEGARRGDDADRRSARWPRRPSCPRCARSRRGGASPRVVAPRRRRGGPDAGDARPSSARRASSTPAGRGSSSSCAACCTRSTGEPLPDGAGASPRSSPRSRSTRRSREYRYCTSFVVEGEGLDLDALHAELEPLGDSLLVTGDASIAKVHVHTDEPGRRARRRPRGRRRRLDGVEIGDMHSQAAERERWLAQLHDARAGAARRRSRSSPSPRAAGTATSCAARVRRSSSRAARR